MEDSQLIRAYLDGLDGKPPAAPPEREMSRRSPTGLAHEAARSQRMADLFEARASDPLMRGVRHGTPDPGGVSRRCA